MSNLLGPEVAIDPRQLRDWLSLSPDELASRARVRFSLTESAEELHERFADELYADIEDARTADESISLIVPVGPTRQYPLLARRINESQLALDHVSFFGMDEFLDWQGRPLGLEHPFSLEGSFRRGFIDLLQPQLRPPQDQVIFPSPLALDRPLREMERRGMPLATYGGVGFQGHVAFNEPPSTRWTPVSVEQLRSSRTRVLPLSVDTLIAHAQRRAGGNTFVVPPMAVTLGFQELLTAAKIRLYLDTGAWKQTILRILLFSEPTVEYPATLMTTHDDVHVVADRVTATVPPDALAEAP